MKNNKKKVARSGWSCSDGDISDTDLSMPARMSNIDATPLSASITHATMEANFYEEVPSPESLFLYPHNASTSVGLIGSLHNNECIDISTDEEGKTPNMENREHRTDEHTGFICAGHTSHSGEAGGVRRVACSVSVRMLSNDTVLSVDAALAETQPGKTDTIGASDQWVLFCMACTAEKVMTSLGCCA